MGTSDTSVGLTSFTAPAGAIFDFLFGPTIAQKAYPVIPISGEQAATFSTIQSPYNVPITDPNTIGYNKDAFWAVLGSAGQMSGPKDASVGPQPIDPANQARNKVTLPNGEKRTVTDANQYTVMGEWVQQIMETAGRPTTDDENKKIQAAVQYALGVGTQSDPDSQYQSTSPTWLDSFKRTFGFEKTESEVYTSVVDARGTSAVVQSTANTAEKATKAVALGVGDWFVDTSDSIKELANSGTDIAKQIPIAVIIGSAIGLYLITRKAA